MHERLVRLKTWALGSQAPPYRLELHLTNRCNLRCLSCWSWSAASPPQNELSQQRFISLVEEAFQLGVAEFWLVGGGEPMFDADFCLRVQECIKRGQGAGHLVTNGTLFTPRHIERLVAIAWDMVVFSLDGPNAAINDLLRNQKGVFSRVTTALDSFRMIKTSFDSEMPVLRINTVISKHNIEHIESMLEVAAAHGVREVLFHGMNILSPQCEQLMPTQRQLTVFREHLERFATRARELNVETNIAQYTEACLLDATNELDRVLLARGADSFLDAPCFDPWDRMVVLPDGRAGSCNAFRERGLVNRQDRDLQPEISANAADASLSDIWYGSIMNTVRSEFIAKRILPICVRCCVGNILENRRIRELLSAELALPGSAFIPSTASSPEKTERRA